MAERRARLEGKVAIVTGAGSRGPGIGNGKATAILFARAGAQARQRRGALGDGCGATGRWRDHGDDAAEVSQLGGGWLWL